MIEGIDPNASTPDRTRRNWARIAKFGPLALVPILPPIKLVGSPGTLSLTLSTVGGLSGTSGSLTISLATNSGLTLSGGSLSLATLTTKGDLLGFGTTLLRLPVGSDGQILTADSSQTSGIKWATSSALSNPMTMAGDIIIGGVAGAPTRLATGSNGQVLTMVSGSPAWTAGTVATLTTKGDLLVFDTGLNRLPVGSDTYVLTADSTQPSGMKWAAGGGGGGGTPITTRGDMIIGDSGGSATRLPIGPYDGLLTANGTDPSWQASFTMGIPTALNFTDSAGSYVHPIGMTATANAGTAANAIDQSASTTWSEGHSVNTTTDFLTLDLHSTLTIGGVLANLPAGNTWPAGGSIQTSTDGVTFTTVASWLGAGGGTGQGFSPVIQGVSSTANEKWSFSWTPGSARYVKFLPTVPAIGSAVNFWQALEVSLLTSGSVGGVTYWPAIQQIVVQPNQVIRVKFLAKDSYQGSNEDIGIRIGPDTSNWYGVIMSGGNVQMQQSVAGSISNLGSSVTTVSSEAIPVNLEFDIGVQQNPADLNWLGMVVKTSASPGPFLPQYIVNGSVTLSGKTLNLYAYTDSPNLRFRGLSVSAGNVL